MSKSTQELRRLRRQALANAGRWKRRREDGKVKAFESKESYWEHVAADYGRQIESRGEPIDQPKGTPVYLRCMVCQSQWKSGLTVPTEIPPLAKLAKEISCPGCGEKKKIGMLETHKGNRPARHRTILRQVEVPKLPAPIKGMERSYMQCKTCGRVYYHDYVPCGLPSSITVLPCNHDLGRRTADCVTTITKDEFMRLFAIQLTADYRRKANGK